MALILNNFSSDWIPVLTQDKQSQETSQPTMSPFSDAYLSLMPTRKRNYITNMRPSHSLEKFINESVKDVCSQPQIVAPLDTEEMRQALLEQIRLFTQERASTDTDYNSDNYTAIMQFLHPKRTS